MTELVVDQLGVTVDGASLVKDVSFTMKPGELVIVLGPNGAGKTKMLRAALGLEKPSSGMARLNGVDTQHFCFVGVGLSSFAGAAMSLLMNLAPNPFSLSDMINWMLGSVANRSFDDLAMAFPFLFLGLGILFYFRRGLSALTLGEEAASGIGVDLKRLRIAVVMGTGLTAGAAVAAKAPVIAASGKTHDANVASP